MKKISMVVALLILTSPSVALADAQSCMASYYKTKDQACIDQILSAAPPSISPRGKAQINPTALGFVAGVFKSDPQEKGRILASSVQPMTEQLFAEALYIADLSDEAQSYAVAKGLVPDSIERLKNSGLRRLEDVKPAAIPGENDLLIGAYMATGTLSYIQNILANFSSADDETARLAFRMGLMQSKFGPTFAPPNREKSVLLKAVCEKLGCKQDPRKLMRVMTLSSAFWALQSLSREDAGIKSAFNGFFENDARLKQIYAEEANAFGNYLVTLAMFAAVPDKANVDKSLSIYEHLGTDKDATAALMQKE